MAIVVLAAVSLTGGKTASALTAPGTTAVLPAIGAHFHATWSDYTDTQRLAVLDKLAAAHVEWVRIDLSWTTMEYSGRGVITSWYQRQLDFLFNAARDRGLKVLGSVWGVPPWANGGASWNVPPTNASEYGRFMGWMAALFKGRVAAWELWNEPNLDYYLKGGDLAKYTAMAKSAYTSIKASDATVPVVVGALSDVDENLVNALYANGIKGYYDVLAIHSYQGPSDAPPETAYTSGGPKVLDHVSAVHDLLVAKGDGAKPIWLTEIGWSSHQTQPGAATWERGVTETQQADYLTRAITFVATKHPYVKGMFWYTERNPDSANIHEANFGLLRYDLSAKPAYNALKSYLEQAAAVAPTTTTTTAPAPTTTTTTAPAPTTTTTTAPAPTTTTTTAPAPTTTTTTAPAPAPAPTTTKTAGPVSTSTPLSYRLVARDGRTFAFGDVGSLGNTPALPLAGGRSIVASVSTPTGGAWASADDGSVFTVGTAPFYGSMGGTRLNKPIVGMDGTPTGRGYWLVASDGGIFSFGDAVFYGSTGGMRLNKPIVGMAATPTGKGYWLVASDGGIFTFGDARFLGSTGSIRLNQPIVGMAPTPTGNGYWLVASDGGIFTFGDAPFHGSTGSIKLNKPITGMVPTPSGDGYWFVASDGGVFTFGDARFLGSAANYGVSISGMVAPAV